MQYNPLDSRYDSMQYRRCGKSGLMLPAISLGLWHNFGDTHAFESSRAMLRAAFDLGITHFDLANNYGPPAGAAEETMGKMLRGDFSHYRDELVISSKAGWEMWKGPYGNWGSRKYLIASLDQSLSRMGLQYVDIFYSHRPDPETPIEETMGALDSIVRSGKALYVGISSYSAEESAEAIRVLKELGTPCLVHQPSYSLFDRWIENGLTDLLDEQGVGSIAFCPLAQGLLTDRYLTGIPEDSRAADIHNPFLSEHQVQSKITKIRKLHDVAVNRGQTLSQMALAWNLRTVTSVIIGASRVSQIQENVQALDRLDFSAQELAQIESILAE